MFSLKAVLILTASLALASAEPEEPKIIVRLIQLFMLNWIIGRTNILSTEQGNRHPDPRCLTNIYNPVFAEECIELGGEG